MTPRVGWIFSGNMVEVKKPFERFVKAILIIGFTMNVVAAVLLYSGTIHRPGAMDRLETRPAPLPGNWLSTK